MKEVMSSNVSLMLGTKTMRRGEKRNDINGSKQRRTPLNSGDPEWRLGTIVPESQPYREYRLRTLVPKSQTNGTKTGIAAPC